MLIRILVLSLGFIFVSPIWSFPCYYTLAKDNCWLKYDVSVDVIDASTEKKIFNINIPAGTPWVTKTFECTVAQSLIYIAKFSPIIWESDKGKTFRGMRNWFLPGVINPGDTAWTIPVCFPKDFAEVPLPPTAGSNCACDFSDVPPVKPK